MGSFSFDDSVAAAFDNMIERSVPFYSHILKLIALQANYYYQPDSYIYDLGCSTGNLVPELLNYDQSFRYIGVDSSKAMLEQASGKPGNNSDYTFQHTSIQEVAYSSASVVVANLTLQFMDLTERKYEINRIVKNLLPGGAFLFVEKIKETDEQKSQLFSQIHHQFKLEQGYTELEVAHKRDALMNVLVPVSHEENLLMLHDAGFADISIFFKWLNFVGLIATV